MSDNINIIWRAKFLKKKNWLNAVKLLEKEIEKNPANSQLLEEISDIYISKKLYKNAIEYLQKARELTPNDSTILFKLGNVYLSISEPHLAIQYYEKIDKKFPEVLYNTAIAYSRINKRDKAITILEDLLKLFPETQLAYYFLVEQYIYRKRYDDAIESLDTAEKYFGKLAKINFLRGINYFYKKNWLKAYSEFVMAEKMKFENQNYYRIYGLCAEKIGKTQQAIELLKKAIEQDPFNSANYIDLATILVTHNRFQEALKIIKSAKKIDPSSLIITLTMNKILKGLNKQ